MSVFKCKLDLSANQLAWPFLEIQKKDYIEVSYERSIVCTTHKLQVDFRSALFFKN